MNPIRDSRNSSNYFEKHFLGIKMYVGCIANGFNWIGHYMYDMNPIRDSKNSSNCFEKRFLGI